MEKTFALALCMAALASSFAVSADAAQASDEYPEFNDGNDARGGEFVQAVKVLSPRHCSSVKGDVTVVFEAKGMDKVRAKCWRQGAKDSPWGEDATLFDGAPGDDGRGEFVLRADSFPNGPMAVRIYASAADGRRDVFELQLYNLGGAKWRQGLPDAAPAPAKGMALVFADDFDGPLSISSDGRGARYAAHKTGGGDFSGWPFSDPDGDMLPFSQQGSFLRIHASKPFGTKGRTGIISSIRADGTGVAVPVPAYFECRLVCHSAPGSWGAFWTLSKGTIGMDESDPRYAAVKAAGCDELDVLECYGGWGPGNPNHGGKFGVTTHWWGQKNADKAPHAFPDAMKMAGKSSWSWTFHDYGLLVTETDTVYYFDGVEVLRHPTGPVTRSQDTWFLINYAIAGISGWPFDLERYGNESDMWVDWVRVYCGRPMPDGFGEIPPVGVKGSVGVSFTDKGDARSEMRPGDIAGADGTAQANWNNAAVAERRFPGLADSEGNATSVKVALDKSARFERCESWGFGGGDERMHLGGVADSRIAVMGVPFEKWDLVVHLAAGVNGWSGDVELKKPNGAPIDAKAVNFGWIGGGRYVEATREKGTDGDSPDCVVVFRDLTAKAALLEFTKRGGKGAAAVAGIQIIPRSPI